VIDLDGPTPLYQQIAEVIAGRIADGTYARGRRIPPARELAEEFGVSRRTVADALALLQERGLLVGVRGRGTFVAPETPQGPQPEPGA
jgi:GntR family transcriptional regulator